MFGQRQTDGQLTKHLMCGEEAGGGGGVEGGGSFFR